MVGYGVDVVQLYVMLFQFRIHVLVENLVSSWTSSRIGDQFYGATPKVEHPNSTPKINKAFGHSLCTRVDSYSGCLPALVRNCLSVVEVP
jgi:hypothetical protein